MMLLGTKIMLVGLSMAGLSLFFMAMEADRWHADRSRNLLMIGALSTSAVVGLILIATGDF